MVAFLFGDEDQQEAAFFGRYPAAFNPLEASTPPAMNTLLSGGNDIHALVSGEWDRYARYQAWTLFPFGLQSRDVARTIENPANVIGNVTGFHWQMPSSD